MALPPNMTIPRPVVQHISRAKSLLKRDESARALEELIIGLGQYDGTQLMGKARFEAEVMIQECVSDLNRQPVVRALLTTLTKSDKSTVAYVPGQESKLKALLPILLKGISELEASKNNDADSGHEKRKTTLRDKGLSFMKEGDMTKAKASFRRLAEEFGEEPGVLSEVAQYMQDGGMVFEAAEFFEQAIEAFPKDSKGYAGATQAYIAVQDYEKAEAVYLAAIKNFGKHTKTMTNLANLYVLWRKNDLAYDAAKEAVNLDPSNVEAQEILDKVK